MSDKKHKYDLNFHVEMNSDVTIYLKPLRNSLILIRLKQANGEGERTILR